MKLRISSVVLMCLAASVAYGSQQPSQTAQDEKTQRLANQQTSPDATSQEEMKFKLLIMSNGITKSGAPWDGKTYETPNHIRVYLYMVHLDSRASAKKEYDDWLKEAARIINQGKVQDKPATKPATTEDRAEIVVPSARECKETTTILATVGTELHIIKSCSAEAAIEFERQASGVRVRAADLSPRKQ